jgi:pimeloyl-ACP methyl ester carboxylesterase
VIRPLILLPGLMCDRAVWEPVLAALSDIAAPACMEWGPEHTSLGKMAEATLGAAPPRFALAGHSMGGRVAFEVYRRAPDRVTHIAVLNTGATPLPPGEAGAEEERGRRRLLQIAREQGVRAMATEWLKGMLPPFRQDDHALTESIIQMFERKDAGLFETQMLALLARPDARPVLGAIRCPALVLTGEDDVWSPPARHREIAEAIGASGRLVLIPRCGHMSTMEQPEAVSAALRAWLAT